MTVYLFSILSFMLIQQIPPQADLYVANINSNEVTVYDGNTGAFKEVFVEAGSGGLNGATGIVFGPDGNLYVSSSLTNRILRYDGKTGSFLDTFVDDPDLSGPFSLTFGPDDHLYVSSGRGNVVRRYHGQTGEFLNIAATHPELRLPIGLVFGHDRMLYVVNSAARNVMRFNPETGVGNVFASDSLFFPSDITFGPEGRLYVSNTANATIARFNPDSGSFDGVYARLPAGSAPMGLSFTSDGKLFVGDFVNSRLFIVPRGDGEPELVEIKGLAGPENITLRGCSYGSKNLH